MLETINKVAEIVYALLVDAPLLLLIEGPLPLFSLSLMTARTDRLTRVIAGNFEQFVAYKAEHSCLWIDESKQLLPASVSLRITALIFETLKVVEKDLFPGERRFQVFNVILRVEVSLLAPPGCREVPTQLVLYYRGVGFIPVWDQ